MPLADLYRDDIGRTDSRTSRRDASIRLLDVCLSTTCTGKISGHRSRMQVETKHLESSANRFRLAKENAIAAEAFRCKLELPFFLACRPEFPCGIRSDKPRARFEIEGSAHRSALELIINEFLRCNSHELGPVRIADERGDGQDAQTQNDFLAAFNRLIALQSLVLVVVAVLLAFFYDTRMKQDVSAFGVSLFFALCLTRRRP